MWGDANGCGYVKSCCRMDYRISLGIYCWDQKIWRKKDEYEDRRDKRVACDFFIFSKDWQENMVIRKPQKNSPKEDDSLWVVETAKQDKEACESEGEKEEEETSWCRHSPILLSQLSGHQGAGDTLRQSKSVEDVELRESVSLRPVLCSCQVTGEHSRPTREPDTCGATEKWRRATHRSKPSSLLL